MSVIVIVIWLLWIICIEWVFVMWYKRKLYFRMITFVFGSLWSRTLIL